MSTDRRTSKLCEKCRTNNATFTCDGCGQSFCQAHTTDHTNELFQEKSKVEDEHKALQRSIDDQKISEILLAQIDQWEKESTKTIKAAADQARTDLKRLYEESKMKLNMVMTQLSTELRPSQKNNPVTENKISQWIKQLANLKNDLTTLFGIKITEGDSSSSLPLIVIKRDDKATDRNDDSSPCNTGSAKESPSKTDMLTKSEQNDNPTIQKSEITIKIDTYSPSESSSYPSVTFGFDSSTDKKTQRLFKELMLLPPMDKNGPMSGKCEEQTYQMENFLTQTFGFRNIPRKCIVQGVKSFQLDKPPHSMNPETVICFPSNSTSSFEMTIKEIVEWQNSYRVYAGKLIPGMDKTFLYHALKGESQDGEEAFRMKFVIRVSTCPILMDFDAKIIPRELNDEWPRRIKLVSVTGIDFAGRKHDVNDILYYVYNWRDVYEVDRSQEKPALANERDFSRKRGKPKGELREDRLLDDLTYMAKLRLLACDAEGVQIVVETGIGLGVFAGEQIGIDGKVRITSALAIRRVLEEDGPSYRTIRAIVFALPIIDVSKTTEHINDTFSEFVQQFQEPQYKGNIPVLIADQDMHRLTVAIARQGFIVSELNPADSHGVFGEYWQNRGPAVEEKLALTTLGLLVQHHLINPNVLDQKNYHII
jgi:hypothetical protein